MAEVKDILTGLDRYETFIEKLDKEIEKMDDYRIAIVYTDIKHFKYINDTYGYQRGDMLLREFVNQVLRIDDKLLCAARVYSDNIVVATRLDNEHSNSEFRDIIYGRNMELERMLRDNYLDEGLKLSTGISVISKDDRRLDAATAVSNANLARKLAKEMKDDCCVLFDNKMIEGIKKEVEITSSLSSAINNGEFKVYYQPKMDTGSLRLIGAEALIRWQKPNGTFVFPDEFIPFIEQSGQIVDLDYFVYREVFKFIADRISNDEPVVPISVNVSRVHLSRMGILEYVADLFDEYQIPPQYVEFELTESIYIDNTEKALQLVEGLHNMGVKVSMDDFGSGYSSLNLLSGLPIDIIKLDKVFLKKANANEGRLKENDKIIISCVVDMARRLKITSLCEGVETPEQSDYLAEIGCEIQQGYYFSKPIPQEDFEEFIDAHFNPCSAVV
ncbi:MAG: GGDEF domain-containing phosphodiesterase [Lachnospiraceae bacterium]|nr:GGDEF domain-containing phosphodiesterase [Lachnospiraceae bacterium]